MNISLDEGFFFVTALPNNKTQIRHKGGTFVMDNCTPKDIERLTKKLDAFPFIMYAL